MRPRRAILYLSQLVTSTEPRYVFPESLFVAPERMLTNVVLPAPLGPISAVILFFGTSNVAPLSAFTPRNDFVMFSTRRLGSLVTSRGGIAFDLAVITRPLRQSCAATQRWATASPSSTRREPRSSHRRVWRNLATRTWTCEGARAACPVVGTRASPSKVPRPRSCRCTQ